MVGELPSRSVFKRAQEMKWKRNNILLTILMKLIGKSWNIYPEKIAYNLDKRIKEVVGE